MLNSYEKERVLVIEAKRVFYFLAGLGIILMILSLIGQYLRMFPDSYRIHSPFQDNIVRYFIVEFDVDSEANLTTYYSASMAAASSLLLFIIAFLKNTVKDRHRFYWIGLAFFLLYISIDDASVIHEKTSKYLKSLTDLGGWLQYKWVILGFIIVGIFAILFFQFWLHLDKKYKILFLLSAALFFGGALGVEVIGGRWAYSFGSKNFPYVLLTTFEQGLQYAGLATLIHSLLLYLNSYFPWFVITDKAEIDSREINK